MRMVPAFLLIKIGSRCLETTKASLFTLHFSDKVGQVRQTSRTGGTDGT
eukprot:gene26100-biopygen13974